MTARILDGRRIADELLDDLKTQVDARMAAGRSRPGLAVVLVGNDPASAVYVRNKRRAAQKVGIEAFDFDLPRDTSESELLELIERLNHDPADPHLAEWAHVLFDQAVLTMGARIEEPAGFVNRLNELLVSLSADDQSP